MHNETTHQTHNNCWSSIWPLASNAGLFDAAINKMESEEKLKEAVARGMVWQSAPEKDQRGARRWVVKAIVKAWNDQEMEQGA